jgi:hypothetical protein
LAYKKVRNEVKGKKHVITVVVAAVGFIAHFVEVVHFSFKTSYQINIDN